MKEILGKKQRTKKCCGSYPTEKCGYTKGKTFKIMRCKCCGTCQIRRIK